MTYWVVFFGRFVYWQKDLTDTPVDQPAVSVLICAHQEATNLRKNLPKVLSQDYPDYEVLLVDDASSDNSWELLQEMVKEYPRLKAFRLKEKQGKGKKAALDFAISKASNNWLLLTDADGIPASTNWISAMMAARQSSATAIVLGYGPYVQEKTLINRWIRFETHYSALQYFSAASWGIPYMGVGRNLLYQKQLYRQFAEKLKKHHDLASGDDDLFISMAASAQNTSCCLSSNSFVYSEPKRSFKALYRQKTRHYSTSTRYRPSQQALLGGLSLSHFLFWILLFCTVFFYPYYCLLYVFIRFLVIFVIWRKTLCTLGDKNLLKYVFLLDLMAVGYYFIFAPSLFVKKSKHWQ